MEPAKKKPRVVQKFKSDYSIMWPFVKASRVSENHAFCSTCAVDFSIAHGGRDDVRKHVRSKKHEAREEIKSKTVSVSSFFNQEAVNKEEQKVVKAEMLFLRFLVEHNIPLAASDHAGELFRAMFPDSDISKKYGSGRTKTTAISKCMAKDLAESLALKMKHQPFSIATDGSNDGGEDQIYPIVVRYYNADCGKIMTELLNIPACKSSSTGENIFKLLDNELKRHDVSWQNCIAFGCDNASVMTGKHKGVAAFIKKENSHVQIQGCPCHLLHLAAKAGNSQLSINAEEVLIDLFYYFDKSSKRRHDFQQFQEETGVRLAKILKHGPTRWLSLFECITRLIEQWPALEAYFNKDSGNSTDRQRRIKGFFSNPMSKAYCLFLKNIMPLFLKSNVFLQKEEPVFHKMQESLQNIIVELLIKFVKPKVISECENIFEIQHNVKANQKHRQDVVLGAEVREYLTKLKDDKKISHEEESTFFNEVRCFLSESCRYITEKLPLQDKVLTHAQVLSIKSRMEQSFNSLEYLINKFPCLLPREKRDQLETQFMKYQIEKFPPNILEEERIDVAWHLIGQIKDCEGNAKYHLLSKVMLGLCVLPHSNASSERVFSLVRKAKTEFRASMSTEVLSSLMIQRVAMIARNEVCYNASFTKEQLSMAKSARRLCQSL